MCRRPKAGVLPGYLGSNKICRTGRPKRHKRKPVRCTRHLPFYTTGGAACRPCNSDCQLRATLSARLRLKFASRSSFSRRICSVTSCAIPRRIGEATASVLNALWDSKIRRSPDRISTDLSPPGSVRRCSREHGRAQDLRQEDVRQDCARGNDIEGIPLATPIDAREPESKPKWQSLR